MAVRLGARGSGWSTAAGVPGLGVGVELQPRVVARAMVAVQASAARRAGVRDLRWKSLVRKAAAA